LLRFFTRLTPARWRALSSTEQRAWRTELALALGVVAFSVAVRCLLLEPVEIGGDALNKWQFVREWFHAFEWRDVEWNHHLTRLGVNVPLAVIQALFGRHAGVYHVAAVAAASAAALFVYVAGRLADGRVVGLLAAIWSVLFPAWVRAGAQVSPDSFGAAWGLLGLILLLAYERAERRPRAWLVGSAACLFGAYLAKEPLVFFLPGALVSVWLMRRRLLDVAIYAAVPLALLGLETTFYRAVSDYSSRFAIVSSTHGREPFVVDSVFDAFGRFSALPGYWYPPLVLLAAGAVALPFLLRDRRFWPVVCLPLGFFFCYTFAFRRLSPLTLWTRFIPRYFDAAAPFAVLASVLLVVAVVRRVAQRSAPGFGAFAARSERFGAPAALALLAVVTLVVYVANPPGPNHPLRETRRFETTLTDAYVRGIPIVTRGSNGYKALKAAYSLYIDDEVLLQNGRLLRYARAYGKTDRMVRPDARPWPKRCTITLSVRDRWLKMDKAKLDPECG
jgi:hypothetical protein